MKNCIQIARIFPFYFKVYDGSLCKFKVFTRICATISSLKCNRSAICQFRFNKSQYCSKQLHLRHFDRNLKQSLLFAIRGVNYSKKSCYTASRFPIYAIIKLWLSKHFASPLDDCSGILNRSRMTNCPQKHHFSQIFILRICPKRMSKKYF